MMIVDCSSYGIGSGVKPRKRLRPYDDRGRFVSTTCRNPECTGTLIHEGDGWWKCDGLVDTGSTDKELECCSGFDHFDGDPYPRRR